MGRGGIIAIVAILAVIGLAIVLSSRDAVEGPSNTPSDRSEVPAGGGTQGVPAERQNPQ